MLDLVALLRPHVNDLRTITVSFENPLQFTLRYRNNLTGEQQTRLFSLPAYIQGAESYYFVYDVQTGIGIFLLNLTGFDVSDTTVTVNGQNYDIDKVLVLRFDEDEDVPTIDDTDITTLLNNIQELETNYNNLANEFTELENNYTTIVNNISEIQNNQTTIQNNITEIQNNIVVLNDRVNELETLYDELASNTGNNSSSQRPFNDKYSRMFVSNVPPGDYAFLPTSPFHNDLVWVTSEKKLYRYDARSNQWEEVDWITSVKASPEWQNGRLRIISDALTLGISPNGTDWYPCIPAVGSDVIELITIDNTSFSYKYWIAPGQTVIIRNANHFPVIMPNPSSFDIRARAQTSTAMRAWVIYIGDVSATAYDGEIYSANGVNPYGHPYWWYGSYPGHRIGWLGSGDYNSFTVFSLQRNDIYIESVGTYIHSNSTYALVAFRNHSTNVSTAYWIGTSRSELPSYSLYTFEFATIMRKS